MSSASSAPPDPPAAAPATATATAAAAASGVDDVLSPIAQVSLLGDTSEWEHTAADVDLEEDDHMQRTQQDVEALRDALGSEAAAAAERAAKVAAAASAARAAAAGGFATFMKESGELEGLLLRLPFESPAAQRICDILDEYQEQGELLDPHLPHAVTTLMNYVHSIIRPGKVTQVPPPNSTTGAIREGTEDGGAAATVASAVAAYTPSTPVCSSTELLTRVFRVVYSLCKVRGYKTVLHFFPHEVADLEPTLSLLRQQSMDDYQTWETRYGLLLWLSIIVLIPFDLTSVDSTIGAASPPPAASATPAIGVADNNGGIISSLISLGCQYLSDTGAPREAAAVMLSKLFSRADMHARHLAAFFRWCTGEIARIADDHAHKRTSPKSIFLLTGIFRALVEIFRHAPRDVLLAHVALVYEPVLQQHALWSASTNTLVRKLFVKLTQRVGLTYLPVRVAKWRYQRGHRSLLTTLQGRAAISASSNPVLGSSSAQSAAAAASEDADDDEEVPEEMETIIQILLDGLRDRDTVVRWSSAKGIGRITNCLSAAFGDDVVASVLELFTGRESDAAWHGGCLALAELARRGLLLPERLGAVVPLTLRALTYDQRTATHSVGAHVRDASCYVIWAFARAYAPEVMTPYMRDLAQGLLTICVFDREVNVRRASSAAFQEHVGRQGSASFPHGMAILQLADYFTISNRAHAYTVVSFQVARFDEYTLGLVEHLLQFKVRHWEREIRQLTAQTLGILTRRNDAAKAYMRDVVVRSLLALSISSTDLVEKHGSLLAVAAILLSLHAMDPVDYIPVALRLQVCDVINQLTAASNAHMLNGRGGQIMREAICQLIETVARIGLLWTNAATQAFIRPYQALLDENVVHTNEDVQAAAVRAIEHYVRAHYLPAQGDLPKVAADKLARAKPVMDHYTRTLMHPSSLAGATRGFAAALGTLPRALLITTTAKAADVYAALPKQPTPAAAAAASSSSIAASAAVAGAAAVAAASAAAAAALPPSVQPTESSLIYQPMSRILQSLIVSCSECAQPDAETRRNAVQALARLVETLTDDDLLQFMTPMPAPPAPTASVTIAPPPAAAGSSALSAAREKEQKLAAKLTKSHQDALAKYWHRDLSTLGLGPHANRVCERIATALLICLDDYATDNRGDVGSWVREAAMLALQALLQKLARIHAARPNAQAFPPLLSERVFPALLKQSVEKIDRVREHAGKIFFHLLWAGTAPPAAAGAVAADSAAASTGAEIPFIPARDELRSRFPLLSAATGASASVRSVREDKSIDWSSPTQTFPVLVPLLSLRLPSSGDSGAIEYPYHRAILSGLLISVGGLTESVVKSSSDSFLAYVSSLSAAISEGGADAADALVRLKHLSQELLAILSVERGHARVIVPAFKTLELLLSNGLLEPLTLDVSSFASDLQTRVWREVGNSNNIHKLMASIAVLVGLVSYPAPLRTSSLQCLLTLLGHASFPKVRRLTAEALYNALLISSDELVPGADEDPDVAQPVLDIMTLTPWDGPVAQARLERDKLYQLLQVPKPKLKAKAARDNAPAAHNQDDYSALSNEYSSLVREIGY